MTNEEKVLDYISVNGQIAKKDVIALCGYKSNVSAQNLLNSLVKNNKIDRVGNGSATKYILKGYIY